MTLGTRTLIDPEKVPALKHPVCPELRELASFSPVLKGAATVPAAESEPLGEATRSQEALAPAGDAMANAAAAVATSPLKIPR